MQEAAERNRVRERVEGAFSDSECPFADMLRARLLALTGHPARVYVSPKPHESHGDGPVHSVRVLAGPPEDRSAASLVVSAEAYEAATGDGELRRHFAEGVASAMARWVVNAMGAE